jgi:non-specific serine/threonine protein kinase
MNILLATQDLEQNFSTPELQLMATHLDIRYSNPSKLPLLIATELHTTGNRGSNQVYQYAEMPTQKIKLLQEGNEADTWIVTVPSYPDPTKKYILKIAPNGEKYMPEIELLSKLPAHANIMKYIDSWVSEDGNNVEILLEYILGKELFQVVHPLDPDTEEYRTVPLSMETIKKYGLQFLDALEHLHKNGLIHRDIKPENIMIDENDNVKMIDFDTLVKESDKPTNLTGTSVYLAPETIKGLPQTRAVDIWQFGILLYELAFGNKPFEKDDSVNTARAILKGNYYIPPYADEKLAKLIRTLLVLDPKERPDIETIKQDPFFSNGD